MIVWAPMQPTLSESLIRESISTSTHGHSDGQGRARRYEARATRCTNSIRAMIHSWVRWARSKRTPSLVQKYQQCASESQDTWGADPRTEHGANVANCWGAGSAGVCLCLPGVLLPGFRSPCLCCPGVLLWVLVALLGCVAAFAVPACVVPSISSRLTGSVPRTRKSLGSLRVYFIWPVRSFPKGGARKKCPSTMKI